RDHEPDHGQLLVSGTIHGVAAGALASSSPDQHTVPSVPAPLPVSLTGPTGTTSSTGADAAAVPASCARAVGAALLAGAAAPSPEGSGRPAARAGPRTALPAAAAPGSSPGASGPASGGRAETGREILPSSPPSPPVITTSMRWYPAVIRSIWTWNPAK